MIPVNCRVPHKPDEQKYGDCMRACIAAILEMDTETVPHFFEDNCDGAVALRRVREFLLPYGYNLFIQSIDGSFSFEEIGQHMKTMNEGVYYILNGSTAGGNHVVVCCDDRVVCNPAWIAQPLVGPTDQGIWQILLIVHS